MSLNVSDSHRTALNVIYEPFRDGSDWPQQRWVEKELRRNGLAFDRVFEELPAGLVIPDPANPHFFVRPDDPVALTIAGVSLCDGSKKDIDLFLRALEFFVALEDAYAPPPTGGEPLYAGTDALVDGLGLSAAEAARVYVLTRYELGVFGGGGGDPDNWQFELKPEIQRFAGVHTLEQYLDTRIVPRPYVKVGVDLGALVSPSPFAAQTALAAPLEDQPAQAATVPAAGWRRLSVVNRVIEQPLISAVISGVIAAVVGGIILADILGH